MAETLKENENNDLKDDLPELTSTKQSNKVRLPSLHEVIPNSHIAPVDPLRKLPKKSTSSPVTNINLNRSPPYIQKNNMSPIFSAPQHPSSQHFQQRQIPSIKSLVDIHETRKINRIDPNETNHHPLSPMDSKHNGSKLSNGLLPSDQQKLTSQHIPHQNFYHQTQHLPYQSQVPVVNQKYKEHAHEKLQFQKQDIFGIQPPSATHPVGFQTISNSHGVSLHMPQHSYYPGHNAVDNSSDRQIIENPNRFPVFMEQTFSPESLITELDYPNYGQRDVQLPALIQEGIVPMVQNNGSKKIKVLKRTRTGCLTCRKRRIKCDERKPYCLKCERSKKNCLGYMNVEKPEKLQKKRQITSSK